MNFLQRLRTRLSPPVKQDGASHIEAHPALPFPTWWGRAEVDFAATDEQLHRLFAHVQETWTQLGAEDPHWSVLSLDAYLKDNLATNREKFFASGEAEWAAVQVAFDRAGQPIESVKDMIEYGCGVGRVTHWFARRFGHVHAVDISRNHLRIAEQSTAEAGARNVTFHQVTALADVGALPMVDLAYSVIVLQHNPPPIILSIIRALLTRVRPGGYLFLQVPSFIPNYRFSVAPYLAHYLENREMEMHVVPQHVMLGLFQDSGCRVLEVVHDGSGGPAIGSHTYFVQTPR
jgi:2-polyprenyl-3-methyl-5-hydroxy-6-metoxy-1,4-benzoquinol methylase